MIVDANLLLYALSEGAPEHETAAKWLQDALGGRRPIGLPWSSLTAVVRIFTNPRAYSSPRQPADVWARVEEWLASEAAWVPVPTRRHAAVFGDLIVAHRLTGDLVPDARLAALAIEHGVPVASADSDFARFHEVQWINPLR